jgi:hypothetical protein
VFVVSSLYGGYIMIPKGICQCGCGRETNLARQNNEKWGHIKGEPVRFIAGHQGNLGKYRRGKAFHSCGYDQTLIKGHPRADQRGYVSDHILTCEKALGKFLPEGTIPHHIDGDKKNNDPGNLVLCQDREYHNLLHRREIALRKCGYPSWRKCWICKQYDDPNNLVIGKRQKNGSQKIYHRECRNQYRRAQNAHR